MRLFTSSGNFLFINIFPLDLLKVYLVVVFVSTQSKLNAMGVARQWSICQWYAVVVKIQDLGSVKLFFFMSMMSFVMLVVRFAMLMF